MPTSKFGKLLAEIQGLSGDQQGDPKAEELHPSVHDSEVKRLTKPPQILTVQQKEAKNRMSSIIRETSAHNLADALFAQLDEEQNESETDVTFSMRPSDLCMVFSPHASMATSFCFSEKFGG